VSRAAAFALPRPGRLARARLWLSYQRYGLLLCSSALVPATIALLWPRLVWVWLPLALLALAPVRFGVTVLGRWPRKLRATLVAEHRIRAGRFRPESLTSYCGDPCFRLVAHEILKRAGIAAAERRALVARLRAEHEASARVLVLVDHATGTVFTVQGGQVTQAQRAPESHAATHAATHAAPGAAPGAAPAGAGQPPSHPSDLSSPIAAAPREAALLS
jgi:hypothetical protein